MLRDFRDIYDIHAWLRYITWAGLACLTFSLLWFSGGFPPRSWGQCLQLLMEMPQQLRMDGSIVVEHLLVLFLVSLFWLLAWLLLLWLTLSLVRHHAIKAWRQRWRRLKSASTTHAKVAELIMPEWLPTPNQDAFTAHQTHVDTQWGAQRREEYVMREEPPTMQLPGLRLPQRAAPMVQPNLSTYSMRHAQQREQARQAPVRLHEQHSLRASQLLPLEWQVGQEAQTEPIQQLETVPSRPQLVPSRSYTPQGYVAVHDIPTTPGRSSPTQRVEAAVATLPRARSVPRFAIGVGWHAGIVRQQNPNEDNLVVLQGTCTKNGRLVPFGLFVVADGMGGHAFGQEASRLAIQSMVQAITQNLVKSEHINDDVLVELLVDGVGQANQAICKRVEERGKEMGTTVTAALIVEMRAYVVNVGDSRTYLLREHEGLSQITNDHSLVARLVANGSITPDEVYTHPERNKVYRSVGNPDGVEVDWFTVELDYGDSLLLCSDGLWEMVRDGDIERILTTWPDTSTASDELVRAALQSGGADNISVVVVRVE